MSDLVEFAKDLGQLATELKDYSNKARFSAQHGWPYSPMTVDDLGAITTSLANRAESIRIESPESDLHGDLARLRESIQILRSTVVPQIFSSPHAPETIIGVLYAVDAFLIRALGDTDLKNVAGIALKLRNRAVVANDRLDSVLSSMSGVESKLDSIQRAHDAAEELPITQKMLTDAVISVSAQQKAILTAEIAATSSAAEAAEAETKLKALTVEATEYLEKIKDSYRAVTSQGLAQAFSNREQILNRSMLIWVLGLIASLLIAGLIARERFPLISEALKGTPDWGVVTVHLTLAALSLSPAVWFAWMSTTQIGQRFRLAEDYAYKAAISAAYEGYRTEAAQLDPLLQAQLFSSALGRLDELPLRLLDSKVAGTPLHELLKSVEFKKATDAFPELMDKVFSVLRRKPSAKSSAASPPAKEDD